MKSPFPGMDPYLETHELWHDVHLALIQEIRVALAPQVAPRYFVAVEERTYINILTPNQRVGEPNVAIIAKPPRARRYAREARVAYDEPLTVNLAPRERIIERYLEIRETATQDLVTAIEILSPSNKKSGKGRVEYEEKRERVLDSLTNFVEIDLLRAGEVFDIGTLRKTHYRIFFSRGWERLRAQLYVFQLDQLIPEIPIPLRENESAPRVTLNEIAHQVYDTARYDLRIDYTLPPDPPLEGEWSEWAQQVIVGAN